MPRSIVKIGGSLLDLVDLPDRVRQVLEQLEGPAALIVGGGAAANVVRDWAASFNLNEAAAHWLAVDSLDLTARLLCVLLNRQNAEPKQLKIATVAETWRDAVRASSHGLIPVLSARGLLASVGSDSGVEIPESWAATSDSIAAAIAIHFDVPQLVLCKSIDVPRDGLLSGGSIAVPSPIDEWFQHLAPRLNEILWCNLRKVPMECSRWRPV